MGAGSVAGGAGCACLLACPLVAGGQGTLAILLTSAKMDKIPAFRPLSCFACLGLLANMALFRILRAFLARFPLLDVCLYCSRALRGLWGFCVRE